LEGLDQKFGEKKVAERWPCGPGPIVRQAITMNRHLLLVKQKVGLIQNI
jgi:hypothetical protein